MVLLKKYFFSNLYPAPRKVPPTCSAKAIHFEARFGTCFRPVLTGSEQKVLVNDCRDLG